jgi:hypothetical protein
VLTDLGQAGAAPAANVTIAGSSENLFNNPSLFSEPGADVYAVGEGIPTLLGVPTQGTSFAAPQVAGLASYLWLLSPDLRARPMADTIAAIEANARTSPVKFIDAYATVLSLDEATNPAPATAPIRLAILDLDDDGDFDEVDLAGFGAAFIDPATGQPRAGLFNNSRHDLNGDGFTAGISEAAFDLDRVGSTQFGAPALSDVTEVVAGASRTFDETALTDIEILCYYAHSSLYTGTDPGDALPGGCDVNITVEPVAVTLAVGGQQQFAARVTGSNDPTVSWSATCGTINQTGLYTTPAVAPPPPGTCTVTATSNADTTTSADATVTVIDQTGFFVGTFRSEQLLSESFPTSNGSTSVTHTRTARFTVSFAADDIDRAVVSTEEAQLRGVGSGTFDERLEATIVEGGCTRTIIEVATGPLDSASFGHGFVLFGLEPFSGPRPSLVVETSFGEPTIAFERTETIVCSDRNETSHTSGLKHISLAQLPVGTLVRDAAGSLVAIDFNGTGPDGGGGTITLSGRLERR